MHPSVRQKDGVLAGDLERQCSVEIKSEYYSWVTWFWFLILQRNDLFPITLLLLVEVVAFIILHGVSIPGLMF